jgi:curved DNA-binding protein
MSWQPPTPKPPGATQGQQSLYQILQVDPNAHPTIIRYAYRFLAGLYHPDNAESGNPEMFRVVSDAFKTLSDPGKRAAYDAQVGTKAPPPQSASTLGSFGQGGAQAHFIPKSGISYNEVELRLAVLQVLLTARKKRAQTGGASAKVLMDVLGVEMTDMEFLLWYMREKGLILRQEAAFQITVAGVDYLVDNLAKTQVIDDGGKGANISNIQLPATLGSG